MPNSGFPKSSRIIKTDDFSSVFNFRKRISGHYLAIHYQHNLHGKARLGMVVAKKVARLSVDRNYMRRVLREMFRNSQAEIKSLDMIIRVQKRFLPGDYAKLRSEYEQLLFRLNRHAESVSKG